MISAMTVWSASSSVAATGMIPSPLNLVWAKILTVSAVSSADMETASGLPRLTRICFAEARSCPPSGVVSAMAASGRVSARRVKSSAFFRTEPIHFTAARTSGTRMRPSPSLSMSSRVLGSSSRP